MQNRTIMVHTRLRPWQSRGHAPEKSETATKTNHLLSMIIHVTEIEFLKNMYIIKMINNLCQHIMEGDVIHKKYIYV